MTGTRQFATSEALESAMRVFWEKGFEGTSYHDLTIATGLNKSSLYNAFGDKRGLYERCLDYFMSEQSKKLAAKLEIEDFPCAIDGFFETLIERFEENEMPKGCMATAAAIEFANSPSPIGDKVRAQLKHTESVLLERCEKARLEKDLPENTDCEALASFLLAMSRGLAALNCGYGDTASVVRAKDAMMNILRNPPLLEHNQ